MTPVFNVCKSNLCKLTITGLTREAGEYLPEDSTESTPNAFKYSDTITVNVVQIDRPDEAEYVASTVSHHLTNTDEVTVHMPKDGYYIISHIIIPSTGWLRKELEKPNNTLSKYTSIYVSDGVTIFKYRDGQLDERPALELAEINPEGTTISIGEKSTFSVCYLTKCFVTLCNEILNMNLQKCKSKNADLDDLIFKRDFVWMSINVIKYYISLGSPQEAQVILEQVISCNGFCNSNNDKYKSSNNRLDCGCNK